MIKAYTDYDGLNIIKQSIEENVEEFVWVALKPLINRNDYDEPIYIHPSYEDDIYRDSDIFTDGPDERIRVATNHIRLTLGNYTIHINK